MQLTDCDKPLHKYAANFSLYWQSFWRATVFNCDPMDIVLTYACTHTHIRTLTLTLQTFHIINRSISFQICFGYNEMWKRTRNASHDDVYKRSRSFRFFLVLLIFSFITPHTIQIFELHSASIYNMNNPSMLRCVFIQHKSSKFSSTFVALNFAYFLFGLLISVMAVQTRNNLTSPA